MFSTSQLVPKASHFVLWLWWTVERVSAILSLKAVIKKMTHPLSIADLPLYIWLRSHVYRSYLHHALQAWQTRTNGIAPSPTRSLSKYGGISARVSPACNLTDQYNYFQRSAYVRTPVSGLAFRLSLHCTSDTYPSTCNAYHP